VCVCVCVCVCRFQERTQQGAEREGHVWGGVMRPRDDGFTRSTTLHSHAHAPHVSATSTLRQLEPYVARSYMHTPYTDYISFTQFTPLVNVTL